MEQWIPQGTLLWFFGIFCGIMAWVCISGKSLERLRMLPFDDNEEDVPHA